MHQTFEACHSNVWSFESLQLLNKLPHRFLVRILFLNFLIVHRLQSIEECCVVVEQTIEDEFGIGRRRVRLLLNVLRVVFCTDLFPFAAVLGLLLQYYRLGTILVARHDETMTRALQSGLVMDIRGRA